MDRRFFINGLAGSAALVWRCGMDSLHVQGGLVPPGNGSYRVLSQAQAATLEAVATQIIPTDDTPGAREARVVNFIDNAWQPLPRISGG